MWRERGGSLTTPTIISDTLVTGMGAAEGGGAAIMCSGVKMCLQLFVMTAWVELPSPIQAEGLAQTIMNAMNTSVICWQI